MMNQNPKDILINDLQNLTGIAIPLAPPPPPPVPRVITRQNGTDEWICILTSGKSFASFSFFISFIIFVSCKLLHLVMQLLGQPRLVSELIVGLLIGNLEFMHELLNVAVPALLVSLSQFGMSCYLLVVGLEMDPFVLLAFPSREALIAYAGVLSTFIVTAILMPYMNLENKGVNPTRFMLTLSVTLSGTASSVLTRLVTDLKMSNSNFGRLVVKTGMHSDMITLLLIALLSVFNAQQKGKSELLSIMDVSVTLIIFSVQCLVLVKIIPPFINWINENNPEGKSMRGSHLVLFTAFMVLLCSFGPIIVGYSPVMTAFLIGLAFPQKGRISNMLNTKINQFLGYILFPLYFCWIGTLAKFNELNHDDKYIWVKLFFLFVILTIGKVTGTIVASMVLSFHWHEAIALGLLLSIKGHFHIFAASYAKQQKYIGTGSFIVLLFICIFTIAYLPFLITFIKKRAQKKSPYDRQMGLQWLNPSAELRMLLCIHGPQNVPTMINIIEVSRGNMNSKLEVYVTDMIEINECMFLPSEDDFSDGTVTMVDESVVNMREEITNAILTYVEHSGDGINVHRLLAISTFSNMHQDLCNLAEAVQASMIILPYPKKDAIRNDGLHHGFRYVNRKVLRHAPCSVGILVDRGLGLIDKGSSSATLSVTLKVAVVFIGGKDDREALSYAIRIAKHPRINLTAIRFLQDSNADKPLSKASSTRVLKAMQEQEMKLDDEYFAQFYEKNVAHGRVGYVEKHVMNARETVANLKALEGQYVLFIVGRGSRVNSISKAILKDWEEYPDLGPTGEILADKDFSITSSVLVIQQHCIDDDHEEEFTF